MPPAHPSVPRRVWLRLAGAAPTALALLGLLLPAGPVAAGDGVYTLFKDGRSHSIATVTRDGTDFLSLGDLARALGARVSRRVGSEARLEVGASRVELTAGQPMARVDGEELAMSRPPLEQNGRLWVPPDFVSRVMSRALNRAVRVKDQVQAALDPVAEAADPPAAPVRAVQDVRSGRDYTRILLRFDGASLLPYTISASAGRILIRLQADNLDAALRDLPVGDGAVERIRFEPGAGRGLFSIETGAEYRDYQTAVLRDPFRIVIDVYRRHPWNGPVGASPAEAPGATAEAPRARPAEAGPLAPGAAGAAIPGADRPAAAGGAGRRLRTIVLDPGHGGSEPGARGPNDLLEKDVTLDLARQLASALERNLGVRVVLTRSSDADVSLDDRTAIANHEKADLFVSIHANASLRGNARGAETYFLSSSATDDESRTLAALENGVVDEARGLEGTDLELILWNLAQNEYLKESQALAEVIQSELNVLLDIKDRGVKQAPFKVLRGATMPAVLVEVGFISNPEEEERLRDQEYQDKLVTALYRSVVQFKESREVKMGALAGQP